MASVSISSISLIVFLSTASTAAMAADPTIKQFLGISTTNFRWEARDSAPRKCPMEIVAGNLRYQDGKFSDYVPGGSAIANGWGEPISSHGGDTKHPLPAVLDILFFSFTEDQFYRGTFDLPYEKILKLFQEGYYSPKSRKDETYDEVVVGVAPGGVVAVWLRGVDRQTEVFYAKAVKVNLPWSTLTSATHIAREAYVQKMIKYSLETPEAIEALKKIGPPLGLWDRYRTRYNWQPVFTNMPLLDPYIRVVSYFNGESQHLNYPPEAVASRPVPKYMRFIWKTPKLPSDRLIELTFNEAEIFSAFEKLGAGNKPLQLEMKIEIVNGNQMFTVALRNEKERIEFDHTDVKQFAALR
jgi:hypothetical protein